MPDEADQIILIFLILRHLGIYQQKKSNRFFKILMLEMSKSRSVSVECEGCRDRYSNSTQAEECDQCSIVDVVGVDEKLQLKQDTRLSRILNKTGQKWPISHKLVQKSVNFLLKASYIKNLNFETIIHSISLFYCSLTQVSATKSNIECILCACLLISCKLHDPSKLSLGQVVELISHRWSKKQIIHYQSLILQQSDYDIHYQFPLLVLLGETEEPKCDRKQRKEVYDKVQYLAEIVLIQQPNILHDPSYVRQIYEIAKMDRLDEVTQDDRSGMLRLMKTNKMSKLEKMRKIRKIMQERRNLCEVVVNKYRGKFNILGYCGLHC